MNDTASAYSLEAEADVLISDENPAEEERSAQSNAARNDIVKNSHMSLSLIPPVDVYKRQVSAHLRKLL